MTLAELVLLDWARLIRGLADAGALLAGPVDRPATIMMAERMLQRAAREGAQALAWAGQPIDLARLVRGGGAPLRRAFAVSAGLAACSSEVPAGLAQVQRAFAGDDDRRPALVAMFVEAARRTEHLLEQLELAGASEPAVGSAAAVLARALKRARVKPFRPHGAVDFDVARATAYRARGKPGWIVAIERPGVVWHGHVLRKADVIVSDRAESEGSSIPGPGA